MFSEREKKELLRHLPPMVTLVIQGTAPELRHAAG